MTDPASPSELSSAPVLFPEPDEEREPCPTPLEWEEVLRAVTEEADEWTHSYSRTITRGVSIGSGPSLIFLPGLHGGPSLFYLCAWLLKEEFRCVLPNWPDPAPRSIADWQASMTEVVQHETPAPGLLFGTGIGVPLGLHLAAALPGRFAHLVLQGGYLSRSLQWTERTALAIGRWTPGQLRHLPGYRALEWKNHRPWFPPYDQGRFEFYHRVTNQHPIRTVATRARLLNGLAGDLGGDFGDDAGSLPACMLIQTEGEGPIIEREMLRLREALPNASVESMHTTGQLPFLTHPHRMVKLLRQAAETSLVTTSVSTDRSKS